MELRLTHGSVTELEDGDGSVIGIDKVSHAKWGRVRNGFRIEAKLASVSWTLAAVRS